MASQPESNAGASSPRRRRFQFGLRTILLATVVAGVVFAVISYRYKHQRSRRLSEVVARHDVPLPPKGAKLVLAEAKIGRLNSPYVSYSPAFLLSEAPNGDIVVLRGLEQETLKKRSAEPLWREFAIACGTPEQIGYIVEYDQGLDAFIASVQLAERGDTANAAAIWKEFFAANTGIFQIATSDLSELLADPAVLLAALLFERQATRLITEAGAAPDVRRRFEALFRDFPELKTPERVKLCSDLAKTIDAKPPVPGSMETRILAWRGPTEDSYWSFGERLYGCDDDAGRAIAEGGFQTIAGLMPLLDDTRMVLTLPPRDEHPKSIARIHDLAFMMLKEILGNDPARFGDTKELRRWWEETQKRSEGEYFASVSLNRLGEVDGAYELPLWILARRFPERLSPLCQEYARKAAPIADSSQLAWAVANSTLSKEEKKKVLVAGAEGGTAYQNVGFLKELADLDLELCIKETLGVLARFSIDSPVNYGEGRVYLFAELAAKLNDDEVWRKYVLAVKRSTPSLKLEILASHGGRVSNVAEHKTLRPRLKFILEFLDDETARDGAIDMDRYRRLYSGHGFPRIKVRNFAALTVADMLAFEEIPDQDWTDEQWAALRQKVRQELAQMNLPTW